ncbi:MAG: KamA family radical SAM protein [bacterium]|nr:KamA family radical SAM protein [bacterium]
MTVHGNSAAGNAGVSQVTEQYPALVSDYYGELANAAGDPISRQVFPDPEEISAVNEGLPEDPVEEERYSPVTNLTHRYADRVLFLVSDRCPVYCRFCTRKRKVGRGLAVTPRTLAAGFQYIAKNPCIRDVLLSGGDPLMLGTEELKSILDQIRHIPHVEIIRIGTRVPAAMPERVTAELASLLAAGGPLYIHTHFNHPAEITVQSREACRILADAGIPLNNQTVLLRGINDDPDILEDLFRNLLAMRVRPYYLFQADKVRGTGHFRTPLMRGVQIMEELFRRTSPMALPTFAVDLPDGGGKVFPSAATVLNPGGADQSILIPDGRAVLYRD